MKFNIKATLACVLAMSSIPQAFAHTAFCSCYNLDETTVMCEGGFSDFSSPSGTPMTVIAANGDEIAHGEMNENGEFEFPRPDGDYKVVFNAGPGHKVEVHSENIVD